MWDAVEQGNVQGVYSLIRQQPFVGEQCQRLEYTSGNGTIGIANRGLNRWGMCFREGKPYEGHVWIRTEKASEISFALEDAEGTRMLASTSFKVEPKTDWQQIPFQLTPNSETTHGRFVIRLHRPGRIDLGYAYLQPASWGRFKDLPVRGDVAQGLIDQGVRVLRYGGSMVDNPPNYRWKNMIGPRDQRQPYDGHWYDHSTNGWGILDFLNFCEAAEFLRISVSLVSMRHPQI